MNTGRLQKYASNALFYIFIGIFVIVSLLPFIWQALTSFKSIAEISSIPAVWFPAEPHWDYYINVFTKHPFLRYMLNSFIVASLTTALSLFIGASAGYALGRLRFRGKTLVLMIILGVSMFPPIANLSPLYLFLKSVGLLNTYAGLIIPYITFSLPLAVWLMTNYFSQLPRDFEEAAALDGCGRFETYFKVMLPLVTPGLFSTGLLVFINSWNEYIYALTFMTKQEMLTVPVGISLLPSNYELPWGDMSAATIVVTLPLILLVLIFQRRIISGLTAGGVKG